jgi:DNA-binding protein HU-beta
MGNSLELNKADLIKSIAEKTGIPQAKASEAVSSVLVAIQECLVSGGTATFIGFGKFETLARVARIGRNPKTGEKIQIPARRVVRFSPGKALKDAVS